MSQSIVGKVEQPVALLLDGVIVADVESDVLLVLESPLGHDLKPGDYVNLQCK